MLTKRRIGLLAVALLFAKTAAAFSLYNAGATKEAPSGAGELTAAVAPGSKITNAKGSCLSLSGLKNALIENVVIGPCGGHGIELHDSHNVVIRNVVIEDTQESGILIAGSTAVDVLESRISRTISGVYALNSKTLNVSCNTIVSPRGPIPRGQFVQFDKVTGSDNRIRCNSGHNEPGQGEPEDAISLYQSHGTAQSPITVADNLIVGGGPSESGGGIMLGDSGGSYQVATRNVLVDPGQYGIAVSSGHDLSILDNVVYARRQPFTNVGIYTWNQYDPKCHSIRVEGNEVKWISKTGAPNPFWDGENCGVIKGEHKNNFAAKLTADLAERKPVEAQCSCKSEGWR
ncbi:right-handed parallel beta-helix repeat-containing protein [Hyphomicrobium sp.]|uniref:right-handed parallel beta-helix repeat-containing protein n=1 Tax=Hyphomicrobium sp. TaxID=82 RepID=UPI0025BF5A07|nr:right-handed parallel beta-helix repeat-containing protein [Hyphomicrobium sp.]MCC7250772.1 right-handed parallel beta-helix repeat-containing protein [Hyphomicrobium sp.]